MTAGTALQEPSEPSELIPILEYRPFHSYTMEQAVQDGLVLDVLHRYCTVTPQVVISAVQQQQRRRQQQGGGDGEVELSVEAAAAG